MSEASGIETIATMEDLRAVIDGIDRDLVALLVKRASCIDQAARIKARIGLPADIPDRVQEVVDKVRSEAVRTGLDPDLAERLWRTLIQWSIEREEARLGR